MSLSYEEAVNLLTSKNKFYINLGLDRIKKAVDIIGNPQNKYKIIHVAGTNGKGSVCALTADILKCAGYKTGLYTSPHLVNYTERIKINDKEISKSDFARYIEEICTISEANSIELTEFEILTACAFKYFYDNNIDIAVIETGLGGRYDASNIIDNTLISVITSISLDHTDRLGKTIEEIAFEKAGIIKENTDLVISKDNLGLEVIKKSANGKKSNIYLVEDTQIRYENGENNIIYNNNSYKFNLLGLYQKKNTALVLKAVELLNKKGLNITDEALKEGLKTVKWQARLEYFTGNNILTDGAHNPDAAFELRKSLDYYFKNQKKIFIYSTINTKDYKTIAEILFNKDDLIYYYDFDYKYAVNFEAYKHKVNWLTNIKKLNKENLSEIIKSKELKVITGSLYMLGDFYKNYKELLH